MANERGFSLIEVLIAMLVVTIGLIGMAQLMAVTTVVHSDARETSMGTELAQAKLDELSGMNLATAAAVQVTPPSPDSLEQNVANYFDEPATGITRRWKVETGPTTGTRILTLRVINTASRQFGDSLYFRTMLRQW
jgi:prepilin-type N-terminal cleavage/methylation domain-containing protein